MAARWSAWIVWAALAGSLVFWGLRLTAHATGLPAQAQTVGADQAMRGDVLRFLGGSAQAAAVAASAPPPAAARLKLVGAVSSTDHGPSWAVLSVDDKPPRVVRIGGAVVDDWVVQGVSSRSVRIGPAGGAPAVTLDLPQLPPPATGVPPSVAAANGGVAAGGGQLPLQNAGGGIQPAAIQPPPPPPPGADQQPQQNGGDPNVAR